MAGMCVTSSVTQATTSATGWCESTWRLRKGLPKSRSAFHAAHFS